MKFQIFYIHGYGSSVNSDTLKMLQKDFPDAIGLTYDFREPITSIEVLIDFVNSFCSSQESFPIIIGSSLGGWYAEQLTKHVVADYIMYNPSTSPENTLTKYGLPQAVLFKYKQVSVASKFLPTSRSVLLSVDDETIDYNNAYIKYKGIADVQLTDGGHRMTEKNMQLIVARINYLRNQIP